MQEHVDPYRPEGWQLEIYPMPAFPVIVVTNVERASHWYQRTLGFVDVFTMRGTDGIALLAHLRWCKFGDVLLTPAREPLTRPGSVGITLNFTTTNVDDIAERARSSGAEIAEGPVDRPWNTRDVTIVDLDGYRLNFTAPRRAALASEAESFESVMARAGRRPSQNA